MTTSEKIWVLIALLCIVGYVAGCVWIMLSPVALIIRPACFTLGCLLGWKFTAARLAHLKKKKRINHDT